jgi:hypothetical protein
MSQRGFEPPTYSLVFNFIEKFQLIGIGFFVGKAEYFFFVAEVETALQTI